MTTAQKISIATLGTALLVFLAPLAWSASSTRGYFEDGRCMCGYNVYIPIKGDGYFRYSPGHGHQEGRLWTLRKRDGFWEALGDNGSVVARLSFQNGELREAFSGSNFWSHHARVYNLWPIWIAKLRENISLF
jgi:hypothetical protein